MIISKGKFVNVVLEIIRGNKVIRPVDRTIHLRPTTFNSIGVNLASSALPLAMAHGYMTVTMFLDSFIAGGLVSNEEGV